MIHLRRLRDELEVLLWVGLAWLAGLLVAGACRGQSADPTPDRRGEAWAGVARYRGTAASAPVPAAMHVRNEEGSGPGPDGLCVISSVLAAGMYQGVPGLSVPGRGTSNVPGKLGVVPDAPGKGSRLWTTAKARWGGYEPGKLRRLLDEVMPAEKWVSYVGTDARVLDKMSREGKLLGVTMSTGRLYGYGKISHMVNLAHYRTGQLACVVDNNNPGVFAWMPAAEFDRRWVDGYGWAFAWQRARPMVLRGMPATTPVLCLASAGLIFGRTWRRKAVVG